MRVGIDYRPALFGRGGIAVYVRELVDAYARAFPEDRLVATAHRFRRPTGPVDVPSLPPGARLLRSRLPWRAQEVLARVGVGADRLAGGVDVFHGTDYVVMRTSRAPLVTTVHDVLFEELPDCYTSAMLEGLRWVTREIVRTSRRLVVPSERTRRALVERLGAREDRIDVVPHGVRRLPDAPPAREHGDYVLFVGTLEPRKNLARLLEAHRLATARVGPFRLVVAGPRGWMDDALVSALAGAEDVVWEPGVDAARLAALYRGALAVAYPSLGEGFGLPVLEAMSEGRPVLVGEDTACSDLAGDAAVAVDPSDVEAIAEGLAFLVADEALRTRLGARGRALAATFTWEAAARATRAAYLRARAA